MKKRNIAITLTISLIFIAVFALNQFILNPKPEYEEPLRVGFVYDGDESIPYSNNFIRTQHKIEEKYGDAVEIFVRNNVSPEKLDAALEELVGEKCEIIFTTSYAHEIVAKEFAEKYPKVQFCQATGDNVTEEPVLKNYHTFMGEIYQGRYVSGIVAGMKLKDLIDRNLIKEDEAKIGYVGAYPYAEVISGFTAFFLGVKAIVPTATMTVKYSYTWSSFSLEKSCAEDLISDGCVIISQHSDTIGPAIACEEASLNSEKPVFHVGYNQSMINIAPRTSLISTRINWTPYVMGAIEAANNNKKIESLMKGHVHGNDVGAGFDMGWVQMLELNKIIAAEGTEEKIEKTIQAFKKGRQNVFVGDYIGVNPYDEDDTIDLKKGFKENANGSAPTFCYILKNMITVKEDSLF